MPSHVSETPAASPETALLHFEGRLAFETDCWDVYDSMKAGEHDFVLTSRSELAFPGHYLSSVDSERDALTVLKLLYFQERIFVYVAGGELKTDHSFYLAGQRFLTLRYEIERP